MGGFVSAFALGGEGIPEEFEGVGEEDIELWSWWENWAMGEASVEAAIDFCDGEFVTEEGIAGVGEGAGEVLGIDFVSGGEMGVASGGDGELAEAGIGGGD